MVDPGRCDQPVEPGLVTVVSLVPSGPPKACSIFVSGERALKEARAGQSGSPTGETEPPFRLRGRATLAR